MSRPRILAVQSGIWSLYLPVPVFWGVLAAWIPVPPAVMAGVLFGAMAVVNIGVGWKLGKHYDVQSEKESVVEHEAKNAAGYELRS